MILRISAILAASAAVLAGAQRRPGVDFRADVQPIFRDHCVECHGPELQMNGFRLDRRADAMRGGTQSVIGPGNAEGSRLYHRLTGTSFGTQMPPGRPLAETQIATIRQWIDEGAEWPDDASGETPVMPADPDATRLIAAIRAGDEVELSSPALRLRSYVGPDGTTPLMAAALYGRADLVRRLLAAGADPNAKNAVNASALMWAVPDLAKMRLLLDAGADVNSRSDDGRTAVTIASGSVGSSSALRLLFDYGADPWVYRRGEVSPLREAVRVGDANVFRTLLEYGLGANTLAAVAPAFVRTSCHECAALIGAGAPMPKSPPEPIGASTVPRYSPGAASRPTPVGPTAANAATIRAAVERSIPLLQGIDVAFLKQTGCASCHHNSLVSMAVAAARTNGYPVDAAVAAQQLNAIGKYLETWRERTLQNAFIAGQQDTIAYLMLGLAAGKYAPDPATDAQAIWLKRRQMADGRWPIGTIRPPIESNDIQVTATSLRALQAFAPPSLRREYTDAIDRARAWLTGARPQATEERAFRLLGLFWSAAPAPVLAEAARGLLETQHEDGSWSQRDGSIVTDAYATGQALVALRESGAADLASPAYRRGVEFLLRTQFEDGSWFVESRSPPIQAYFESGFPYGVDQWISAAATGWATTALALAK